MQDRKYLAPSLSLLPVLPLFYHFHLSLNFFSILPFALVSISLIRADLANHLLPNKLIYPALVLTFFSFFFYSIKLADVSIVFNSFLRFLTAFASGVLLYFLARGGFGAGDVKLMSLIGLSLADFPAQLTIYAFSFSFIVAGLYSLWIIVRHKISLRSTIPFGPFLIAGTWLAILIYTAIY